MRLEESAGIVQGRFAHGSDVIAFRQVDNTGSRRLSTYAVTGTLDGPRLSIRLSAAAGLTYGVEAVVGKRVIVGTYTAQYSADRGHATTSGRFEIERL
jgi:hypothetical protein